MKEHDYNFKRAEQNVRELEIKLKDAQLNLQLGLREYELKFQQATGKLNSEMALAEVALEKEKLWLERCRAVKEIGFEP